MGTRTIYSCNFCRNETDELMGIYWQSDGGNPYVEPRLASQCHNHLCKKCFTAFREIQISSVTWQKFPAGGAIS